MPLAGRGTAPPCHWIYDTRLIAFSNSSTSRVRLCSSFTRTLNDSGRFGSKAVVPLYDGLVDSGPSTDIIGFHCQKFLKCIGRAVSFHRPYLHLSETLSSELGFSSQRLLCYERVGTCRAGVDLVINEMVELQHVHHADGNILIELLPRPPVKQLNLTVRPEGLPSRVRWALISSSVAPSKTGIRDEQSLPEPLCHFEDLIIGEAVHRTVLNVIRGVDLFNLVTERSLGLILLHEDSRRWSLPRDFAAHPRWVSSICPTFILEGTPRGLSTTSTAGTVGEDRACPLRAVFGRQHPYSRDVPPFYRPPKSLRLITT